ncbi:CLUMA_CG008075, isoform A [Clunio marinus]|uniref:CLUMA_CG008075, isoform A n=1 Tax=Clunio marinus TaxID=568069 RepID=A0A1J1I2K4_9DIPT|nr:CLUMA_CG008075, isoform A [Clunio marinus]
MFGIWQHWHKLLAHFLSHILFPMQQLLLDNKPHSFLGLDKLKKLLSCKHSGHRLRRHLDELMIHHKNN